MCLGGGKRPPAPKPMKPAPPLKPTPPPRDVPRPEEISAFNEEDIVEGKRKTKLKIDKLKAGLKEFGSIQGDVPTAPAQGITAPANTGGGDD
tara:strand:+ start:76 stop:351 length:276 start_codon:yes stop_codon:yes gene_type:complete